MHRRAFLKAAGTSGFALIITPKGVLQAFVPGELSSLSEGFLNPPASAKPGTFYLFMNGNISAGGISKDLEALSKAGIGGLLNYNAGVAIPKGNVDLFSDEWYDLLKHTLNEAERHGLEYAMHNCPGWSSSGGPWVTPEMSMQKVVWSETQIKGGRKLQIKLIQPLSRLGYYEDSAVIAYPSLPGEQLNWKNKVRKTSTNEGEISLDGLSAGNGIPLRSGKERAYLMLEFSEPMEIDSLIVHALGTSEGSETIHSVGPFVLESSDDGETFKKLYTIGSISSTNAGHVIIEPVELKYLRINTPDHVRIEDISFYSREKRLDNWMIKTNAAMRPAGTRMNQRAPWAGNDVGNIAPAAVSHQVKPEFFINSEQILDLTGKMTISGELEWDAPAGNWTILRFGHTTTGVTNRAAPDNGQGLECDKFSKEAFDHHFDGMMTRILPLMKSLRAKGKAAIEIDSYEVGMQNWTRNFPAEFEKSRRYSLMKYMPAFTGRVVNNEKETENFLWDARRVMADMMADNYYGRCAERCHENGLLFYGEPYKLGPMEGLQAGSRMDNVMGEFWARGQRNGRTLKLASSIQHLNGKKIVAAESFTGHGIYSKWQQYPFSMKAQGDYMFTQGLTRIIFHTSAHQPHPTVGPGMTMGPFGTHIDRNVTWFKQSGPWLKYISRCQYMLQQGLFVADLLYFTGEDAPGEEIGLKETPLPAPEMGTHYDYINTEVLLSKVTVKDGRLMLPDGMSYKLLVLPPKLTMSIPVLQKIKELLSKGASIMGMPPAEVSGLTYLANGTDILKTLNAEIWGKPGAPDSNAVPADKAIPTISITAVLEKLGITADFTYSSSTPDPAVNYIHRRIDQTDIYFIANRKRRFESLVCSFRVSAKSPHFWDAATGLRYPVRIFDEVDGRIQIPIHLQPSGSIFVVFEPGAQANRIITIRKDQKTVIDTKLAGVSNPGRYRGLYNNFSQVVWIKPETDIGVSGMPVIRREDIASFAFSPAQGELIYGKGHAICGMTAGRNGLVVYERTDQMVNPVFEVLKPLEGWTHVVLVYKEGVPQVYINGAFSGNGTRSQNIVHPCVDEEIQDPYALYFEGDIDKSRIFQKSLTAEEISIDFRRGRQKSVDYPNLEILLSESSNIMIWKNGTYDLIDQKGKVSTIRATTVSAPLELNNEWRVTFPQGTGAPEEISLKELASLHEHPENGVRYFSGTAAYNTEFNFDQVITGHQYFLDLGQVEVIADVSLNGKLLGTVWQKPYRLNITSLLNRGINTLTVRVTNLWPNRLIGDEQYPEENQYLDKVFEGQVGGYGIKEIPEWYSKGLPKPINKRITFSTWKHYQKTDPLLESGLIGPVRIMGGISIL